MKVTKRKDTGCGVLRVPARVCEDSGPYVLALLQGRDEGIDVVVFDLGNVVDLTGDALYALQKALRAWRDLGGDAAFASASEDLQEKVLCIKRLEIISGREIFSCIDCAEKALLSDGRRAA